MKRSVKMRIGWRKASWLVEINVGIKPGKAIRTHPGVLLVLSWRSPGEYQIALDDPGESTK